MNKQLTSFIGELFLLYYN